VRYRIRFSHHGCTFGAPLEERHGKSIMLTTSAKRFAWFACLLPFAVAAMPADAGDAPGTPATRVDAAGDLLPDGAVARLGSLRLVHVGGVSAVAVSPDGTLLASGVRSGGWCREARPRWRFSGIGCGHARVPTRSTWPG
jgi:hypothetical protein